MLGKEKLKRQLECEIRESLEHKLALRREAPLIGLASFIAVLWGSINYCYYTGIKYNFSTLEF
jgi:hypothetical protein